MRFDDLKLTRQFLNAIEDAGYENATPIQQKAIPPLRAGQDVIGIAQTGTGKTAAFLLPLLQTLKYAQGEAPRGLVLAPTKELVVQIHQEALKFASYTDLRIVAFYGGVGPKKQIEEIADGVDLIVSTPGRFLEIYSRGHVETKKLKHIVLDEADRMMDMGFMPQIRQIQEVIPTKRQNILFSATFPPRVERLAEEFLLWPTRIEVTPESTPVSTVTQYKLSLPNLRTKIAFIEWYVREQLGDDRLLIFTRRKEEAENLFKFLDRSFDKGVRAVHSNKGQNARINAMQDFRTGAVQILIATDVASRGIDVPETQWVINASVPRDPHDYIHRIGRTGRAFREGSALTLVDPAEKFALERIESLTGESLLDFPAVPELETFETPRREKQNQAREIDRELKKRDPNYQGAFHEKKRKSGKRSRRK
ncbi:MAG TPA: DEAD/DEAH box helicase [Flavobacteriales bacterium]|nr:DEAD/DEAH box helicase [Flavobacteriales bacterium]|tara:strand:- start:459 stop:1724 length:1266 start_codon:yes stop_codon:yes gene_type:complete